MGLWIVIDIPDGVLVHQIPHPLVPHMQPTVQWRKEIDNEMK
jgi:hypothetical protein